MAYQNIGSPPLIYLNIPEYLASTGKITIDPVFRTLPVNASPITEIPDINSLITLNTLPIIAILGHSANVITVGGISSYVDRVNGTLDNVMAGFSIFSTNTYNIDSIEFDNGNAGSILICASYEFPHSPDLNLSLSYEYAGIKETTTKGGATLTNQFYNKPPKWGDLGAWELGGEPEYAKSGRRVWSLSFSYLSDSSIFPPTSALVNNETSVYESANTSNNTLLVYQSLQRCIHLCNGGQIPFLFQPDGDVKENYAIAKFDMKSFSFQQTAPNLYSVKMKIREVW